MLTAFATAAASIPALLLLPFIDAPAIESWPYLGLSVLLHVGYLAFMMKGYEYGDLSHVYPITRGSAPLIVTVFAVFVVGEQLSQQAIFGIVIISIGISSLALTRGSAGFRDLRPVLFALGAGCFVAAYTVVDGIGVRAAGSPHNYAIWLVALGGLPLTLFTLYRHNAKELWRGKRYWKESLIGGCLFWGTSQIMIWALAVAPMALVATLRETSIVFALLIGVFFLKEKLSLVKVMMTMAVLSGATILKSTK